MGSGQFSQRWAAVQYCLPPTLELAVRKRAEELGLDPAEWLSRTLNAAADRTPSTQTSDRRPPLSVKLFPWRADELQTAAAREGQSISEWTDEAIEAKLIADRRERLDSGPLDGEPLSGAPKSHRSAVLES